jgi:dTDP-glucose 4,6-dehydratase
VTNALDNISLPLYGNGQNTRDWIFVEEHCEAIDLLLHSRGCDGEIFNIGADQEFSVVQITELILKILDKPKSLIQFVKDRPGHVPRHAVDSSKLRQQFQWVPSADFSTMLERTVQWYIEHEAWWRSIKEKDSGYKEYYSRQYQKR